MLDMEKTIKNLIGLKLNKDNDDKDDAVSDLKDDIICAFEGNEQDIYVETIGQHRFDGSDGDHRAYENTEDAPTIGFYIEDGEIVTTW